MGELAAGDLGDDVAHLNGPGHDVLPCRFDRDGTARKMAPHQQIIFPADVADRERKQRASGVPGVHPSGHVVRDVVREQDRLNTKTAE